VHLTRRSKTQILKWQNIPTFPPMK
jgi:hypothetical protein